MKDIEKIRSILKKYAYKKSINKKCLNDLLKIEDMPISFFMDTLIDPLLSIPKQINPFVIDKKITLIKKIKYQLNTYLIRKYFWFKENKKIKYMNSKIKFNKNPKILFLAYTNHLTSNNTIFRLQKLINLVKKDKQFQDITIFADPLSSNNYKQVSNYDNFYQYFNKTISIKAKKESKRLYNIIQNIKDKDFKGIFENNNLSLWKQIKYGFSFYFSQEFLYFLILYYEMSKKIIEQENIKLIVVTGQDSIFEKCLLAAAHKKRIKSVFIKHGFGTFITTGQPYLKYFSKIALFNKKELKELISFGLNENNFFVSGPVIFDEIYNFKSKLEKREKKKILIATQALINSNLITKKKYFKKMSLLLKELNKIPDIELTIKLHPRDSYKKEWYKIAKKTGLNITVYDGKISRQEFYKLISDTDFLIHTGSTCAFEAMILNKSIITYDIVNIKRLTNDFLKYNVGQFIKQPKQIRKALIEVQKKKNLYSKNQQLFIKEMCGIVDGKASKRVYDEIKKLI